MSEKPLLEIRDLNLWVGSHQILLDVNLTVGRGEILGIVGESGSGKTMTARTILRSLPKTIRAEGQVLLGGEDVLTLTRRRLRQVRARRIGMIFQDPRSHVDPLWTVGDYLTEGMRVTGGLSRAEARTRAIDLLQRVGITDGARRLRQYPDELSGGMLQRVMIAGAIAGDPELLIADEATTSLDVTNQAEVVAILDGLRRARGLSIIFITHDLALAGQLCDRTLVMYAGRVVEERRSSELFRRPQHPYSAALLGARPSLKERRRRLETIPGQPASALDAFAGCPFHPRCAFATDRCASHPTRLQPRADGATACLRIDEIAEQLVA